MDNEFRGHIMSEPVKPRSRPPVQRPVPAVTRAIRILRFLAKTNEPIGVVALAREVGLIPSTCLHIVRILTDEGFLAFNPQTKRYSLGAGVLSLASAFSIRNPFVQVVREHLEDLSHQHGCAFAAVEVSGADHFVVVAIGDVHAGLSVRLSVGMRFPAFISATGRCLAAFGDHGLSQGELKKRFQKLQWDVPPKFEDWLVQVEQARTLGYALEVGNYIKGVTIVAVPAFDAAGVMLGCLTAVGLSEQLVGKKLTALIKSMQDVARQVNREFGAEASVDPVEARRAERARRQVA
jgi:DNA-binding IclR family transcriptional regulator